MKTISPEELKTILENHKHWLYEDCEGWENMRANLRGANLSYADLSCADFRGAEHLRMGRGARWYHNVTVKEAYLAGAKPREKKIAKLEEKISVLLSCKNCPENKGGYICEKEYENKCLAQKIQFIKELQEEIAELKKKAAEYRKMSNFRGWSTLCYKDKYDTCLRENTGLKIHNAYVEKKLSEAKDIIKKFWEFVNNESEYDPEHPQKHTDLWNKLCEETEKFIKEE